MRGAVLLALAVVSCRPVDVGSLRFRCGSDLDCVDGARCDGPTRTCTFAPERSRDAAVFEPPPRIDELAVTAGFACYRRQDEVWCWGEYTSTCTDCAPASPTPTFVADGVDRIHGGGNASHVCLEADGAFVCIDSYNVRTPVAFTSPPHEVVVGANSVCAATASGLECVPLGPNGRDGRIAHDAVMSIAAGQDFGCAVAGGQLRCLVDDGRFAAVVGLDDLVEVTAGAKFVCVRRTNDEVRCAGEGATLTEDTSAESVRAAGAVVCLERAQQLECHGTWNDNTSGHAATTATVAIAAQVEVGVAAACLLDAGRVSCMGGGALGQLGPAVRIARAPTTMAEGVVGLEAGPRHACMLDAQGGVRCFGSNDLGALGPGPVAQPIHAVDALSPARALGLGSRHTCAIDTGGDLRCLDAAGAATLVARGPFVQLAGDDGVICARTDDGRVFCRASFLSDTMTFVEVVSAEPATWIAGDATICGVFGGRVACIGDNTPGSELIEVGGATSFSSWTPISDLPSDVERVSVAIDSACALDASGTAFCWGRNASGQLGQGFVSDNDTFVRPAPIDGIDFASLDAGIFNFCGVDLAGDVHCWGQSWVARLGVPFGPSRSTATKVPLLRNVTDVSMGREYGCARHVDGRVSCWGWGVGGVFGEPLARNVFVGVAE